MNTKLHAICDCQGRPLNLFVTAGQVSDYTGAPALLSSLPKGAHRVAVVRAAVLDGRLTGAYQRAAA